MAMQALTQGQGSSTEMKERGILAALEVNLKLCSDQRKFIERFPYWHIDLHSGGGWNEDVNCIGSPLAFLQAIAKYSTKKYRAYFCDNNAKLVEQLRSRPEIAKNDRCHIFCRDNRDILPLVAARIRSSGDRPCYAMGSILVDPNGCLYGGKEPAVPMRELEVFCREFPRIDILINFNLRTWRMLRGCIQRNMKGFEGKASENPAPSDVPKFFGKEHWLIRDRLRRAGDDFIFFIGRNYPMDGHANLGFYRLDTPRGQTILRRAEEATMTSQESLYDEKSVAYPD